MKKVLFMTYMLVILTTSCSISPTSDNNSTPNTTPTPDVDQKPDQPSLEEQDPILLQTKLDLN